MSGCFFRAGITERTDHGHPGLSWPAGEGQIRTLHHSEGFQRHNWPRATPGTDLVAGAALSYGIAAAESEIGWYKRVLRELEEQPCVSPIIKCLKSRRTGTARGSIAILHISVTLFGLSVVLGQFVDAPAVIIASGKVVCASLTLQFFPLS